MKRFLLKHRMQVPIAVSPMAGVMEQSAALSLAVSNAGGLGAVPAVNLAPTALVGAVNASLAMQDRERMVQLNLWLPLSPEWEQALFTARGFDRRRVVVSTVFGLWSTNRLSKLRAAGFHSWWAAVGSLDEALQAEQAGADAVVLQLPEAGGHRASLLPDLPGRAEASNPSLREVTQRLRVPVIAAGGIACGRSMADALAAGAVAVQCGSLFLRSPEAALSRDWLAALDTQRTTTTRIYSARLARAMASSVEAATAVMAGAPLLTYPEQRVATRARGIVAHMAGTEAYRSEARPAAEIVQAMWSECQQRQKNT